MKIVIETCRHEDQRYVTLGDYWVDSDGTIQIRVSAFPTGDYRSWPMQVLIAVHELIEMALCLRRGISEPDIRRFDETHPNLDDPGNDPAAPYHKEHVFAENVERLLAQQLGVDWKEYEALCRKLFFE